MAPISEKRSQPQSQNHSKENGHPHGHGRVYIYPRTKENASAKHTKKGLEILDFHESWLEEMEIYKDKLYVHKYTQQQQLLGSHNHALKQQIKSSSVCNSVGMAPTVTASEASGISNAKRKVTNISMNAAAEHNASITKSRIVVRNAAAAAAAAAAAKELKQQQIASAQLLLKRPREETGGTHRLAGGSSKRHAHPHSYSHLSSGQSQAHSSHSGKTGGGSSAGAGAGSGGSVGAGAAGAVAGSASISGTVSRSNIGDITHNSSVSSKGTAKIIVNQFHASSLLSAHQHEEKTKILTQNGLTKSAATAYETSLYASHYLPQDNRSIASRFPNGDYTNYVGVALANKSGDSERTGPNMGITTTDEDPCAAIDDVNDYTDSDSDDEYTGYPFYLTDDLNETHQSRNIRYYSDRYIPSMEDSDSELDQRTTEYYRPSSILSPSIFPNVPPYLNFSSHAEKGPSMPPSLHRVLKWKLSPVMPKIVKRVVLNSGFRIIKNTTDWMAIWEKHMKSPGFRTIRSHQKYNHMPGSFRIGRKDSMWRSIYNNMKKFGRKEFGFMQKSYIMPDDLENLRQVWPKNASKLTKWIVKPPASARGTGIRIVNKWSQFPKDRPLVVQKYIERPLLINDNKFDMRIYVIVTSINPLRIYMYKDGLARFASVKYSSELTSLDDRCMHLTNYSINKFSQNYSKNEDFNACQGHKWTLQSLWSCLEARGVNTKRLWATLRNLVIKAIISGESGLNRMYRQNVNFRYNCFELFGFDVLLDENLIPWLLEINISPSLHSELPLDLHVKGPLIQAVLNTALYQVPPKLSEKQQNEILEELHIDGPLCHDKRIFTTCLTAEEVRKHNQFTNRSIEFREEYVDSILDSLQPDDVRCLIIAEDELARCKPLERVFPTPDTHIYLKFIDNPRYYNRLLDAWEHRFGHCRDRGIELLSGLCEDKYHLQVSDAALEKEPNVTLTEIDLLHQKKSDDTVVLVPNAGDGNAGDSPNASKDGSHNMASGDANALNS